MSQEQFSRAIGIFSVVSSPSRLEILRQLNSADSMSYSELKASTGFRAKKESGKFAYHLRKLLRQGLIQHSRTDKRYRITPLGRLVLNAAREIDERALLHVEQVMIRTTRETMEPFSANKLVQSLIKEAGLSKDAAQKLASEVEHFVMSHEGLYLTTPLVREMASYLLLVNGREEERYRFAKLGISAWDLESAISAGGGLQNALRMAGQRALRERELFSLYPKDVVDAHLDGELNLREVGTTSLAPDHVSVPLKSLGGSLERLLSLALSTRVELSIVVPGGQEPSALRSLLLSAEAALRSYGWPVLLNAVLMDEGLLGAAEGMRGEGGSRVAFTLAFRGSSAAALELASRGLAASAIDGGASAPDLRSFMGMPVDPESPMVSVVGASINLPRLTYETQGDESYFSARLLQAAEKAASALEIRLRQLSRISNGHPQLAGAEVLGFVNLVGYAESPPALRLGLGMSRLVESAGARAAIAYDHRSAQRMRRLDADRIPPTELPRSPGWALEGYTSGHYVQGDGSPLQSPPMGYAVVVQSHEVRGDLPPGGASILPTFRVCRACGALNPPGSTSCSKCGSTSLSHLYADALS